MTSENGLSLRIIDEMVLNCLLADEKDHTIVADVHYFVWRKKKIAELKEKLGR